MSVDKEDKLVVNFCRILTMQNPFKLVVTYKIIFVEIVLNLRCPKLQTNLIFLFSLNQFYLAFFVF
jgi:hypothetical protein